MFNLTQNEIMVVSVEKVVDSTFLFIPMIKIL